MLFLYTALTRAKKKVVIYNNTNTAIRESEEVNKIALFSDIEKASKKIREQANKLFSTYGEIVKEKENANKGDKNTGGANIGNTSKGNTGDTNTGGTNNTENTNNTGNTGNTGNTNTAGTNTGTTNSTKKEESNNNVEVKVLENGEKVAKEKASGTEYIVTNEASKKGIVNEAVPADVANSNIVIKEIKTAEQLQKEIEDTEENSEIEVNDVQGAINGIKQLTSGSNNKTPLLLPNGGVDLLDKIQSKVEEAYGKNAKVEKEEVEKISNGITTKYTRYVITIKENNGNTTRIEILEAEVEEGLELLEQKIRNKKDNEFNEFLAKINEEANSVVFSSLYIPKTLYDSDKRDDYLSQISNRINSGTIVAGDYKIVRTNLVNILTGEEQVGYALYDKSNNYIASIWENVSGNNSTKANEIVSKFVEKDISNKSTTKDNKKANEKANEEVKITLSKPKKILPLSLSVSSEAEPKTLTEVVNNLKSLGYIVHPYLLISDSGDVALLFFNDEKSYKEFLKETENLSTYKEYKKWLNKGNKYGVGFIFFRERSLYKQRNKTASSGQGNEANSNNQTNEQELAFILAGYMLDTLSENNKKDISEKNPEERKNYVRDMREFFSLSRFLKYNLVRDKDGNIIDVNFEPNWYGHLFLSLLSAKRYGTLKPKGYYTVDLPDNIDLEEAIVDKDTKKKYIRVPYYDAVNNKDDFVLSMTLKINEYSKRIEEIAKNSNMENKEKEKMIRDIMNRAVVTKLFTNALLGLKQQDKNKDDLTGIRDLADIIEKANLQYNAVRGNTFFHNKSIEEVEQIGDFFETNVMMPMPYLNAVIDIKENIENNTENKKNDCVSGVGKGGLNLGKKRKL